MEDITTLAGELRLRAIASATPDERWRAFTHVELTQLFKSLWRDTQHDGGHPMLDQIEAEMVRREKS